MLACSWSVFGTFASKQKSVRTSILSGLYSKFARVSPTTMHKIQLERLAKCFPLHTFHICLSHIFSLSEHTRNSCPGIAQIHLKIPILNDPLDTEMAGAEYLGQARCAWRAWCVCIVVCIVLRAVRVAWR